MNQKVLAVIVLTENETFVSNSRPTCKAFPTVFDLRAFKRIEGRQTWKAVDALLDKGKK